MTVSEWEAIAILDGLDPDDPETAHGKADAVLLEYVPAGVRDAYWQLVQRCEWWGNA